MIVNLGAVSVSYYRELHLQVHWEPHLDMFNPLYTGVHFHCYMLNKSICHFRDVGSILLLSFYF